MKLGIHVFEMKTTIPFQYFYNSNSVGTGVVF